MSEGFIFLLNHKSIWPSLIEKAYPKLYGGYDRIMKGNVANCLKDFTGAPTKTLSTVGNEDIAAAVYTALKKKYLVAAVSHKEGNEEGGIKSGYAYSIIGGNGAEEIHLKSNFGAIKGFGYNDNDKGFSMSAVDFQENFDEVVICKLHKGFTYSACPISFQNDKSKDQIHLYGVQMKVPKSTHIFVSVNQQDKRNFKYDNSSKIKDYAYSYGRLQVFKLDDKDEVVGYMGGACGGLTRDFFWEGDLTQGNYFLIAEMEWSNTSVQGFVVSTYAQVHCNMVEVKRKDPFVKLIEQMPKWFVKENIKRKDAQIIKQTVTKNVTRFIFQAGGRVFFLYTN